MKVILGIKRLGTSLEGRSYSRRGWGGGQTVDSLHGARTVSGKSCLIGSGLWGP